jgi:hypothetical protein
MRKNMNIASIKFTFNKSKGGGYWYAYHNSYQIGVSVDGFAWRRNNYTPYHQSKFCDCCGLLLPTEEQLTDLFDEEYGGQ